jgi:ribosomal protein S18 acetylase RimI-like enzyme
MSLCKFDYRINTANEQDIMFHLQNCDEMFFCNLSEKVDISEYSQKIKTKAVLFEAWINNVLIGLIAVYYTNIDEQIAYITNVSISKKYENMGIASKLMTKCILHGQQQNFKKIGLEVDISNIKAIRFYEKFNFRHVGCEEKIIMQLEI